MPAKIEDGRAKATAPLLSQKRRWPSGGRQCVAVASIAVALAGCGSDTPPLGVVGHVAAYFGGVAADEPHAALVGRDALSAGGSAADAVVAMALTMTVTRPDVAGLGGGGVCVYFDRGSKKAQAIEFLPRAARTPPPPGRWIATVPGIPRGLFALHARYGRLRWEQVVQPAENLARFGTQMSRGFDRAITANQARIASSPDLRTLLAGRNGRQAHEGDSLRQLDLSGTLSRIRTAGPGPFYSGQQAREYVDAVRAAGGWLDVEDMRAYRPVWRETIRVPFGDHEIHFAPSPAVGGRVAAAMFRDLSSGNRFVDASESERARLLAEAAQRAYGTTLGHPGAEQESAGVLAMDHLGNAAACVLTMNRYFGTGHVIAGTGVIAVPPADGGSTLAIAPVLMANFNQPQAFMAATGAGDGSAPVTLVSVMLRVLRGNTPPAQAVTEPHEGDSRVSIMYCSDGLLRTPEKCSVASDPRGYGYAINAER